MDERNLRQLLELLQPSDVVLDVGAWACPFNRDSYVASLSSAGGISCTRHSVPVVERRLHSANGDAVAVAHMAPIQAFAGPSLRSHLTVAAFRNRAPLVDAARNETQGAVPTKRLASRLRAGTGMARAAWPCS